MDGHANFMKVASKKAPIFEIRQAHVSLNPLLNVRVHFPKHKRTKNLGMFQAK